MPNLLHSLKDSQEPWAWPEVSFSRAPWDLIGDAIIPVQRPGGRCQRWVVRASEAWTFQMLRIENLGNINCLKSAEIRSKCNKASRIMIRVQRRTIHTTSYKHFCTWSEQGDDVAVVTVHARVSSRPKEGPNRSLSGRTSTVYEL